MRYIIAMLVMVNPAFAECTTSDGETIKQVVREGDRLIAYAKAPDGSMSTQSLMLEIASVKLKLEELVKCETEKLK